MIRPLGIVGEEVPIEDDLHLLEGSRTSRGSPRRGMLSEKGAMPALVNADGLWPGDPDSLVLNIFELRNSSYGRWPSRSQNSRPLTESTASIMVQCPLSSREPIAVERLNAGGRQFVGAEPGPGMPAETVDGGLRAALRAPLKTPTKKTPNPWSIHRTS